VSTENDSKDSVAQSNDSPNEVQGKSPLDDDPVVDVGFLARQINSAEVGVDREGLHHHYWRGADAIVVYDDSGVDRVEYLDGRRIEEWVKFVDQERGWAHPGQLASALIEADKWRKK
jgi:hypothetical protein